MNPIHSPTSVLSWLRPLIVAAAAFCMIVVGWPPTVQAQDESPTHAVGMLQVEGVSASVLGAARASVTGPDGEGKDGPLATVGMELAVLYHQHRVAGAKAIQALREGERSRPKTGAEGRRGAQSQIHSPISADGQFVAVEAIAATDPTRLLQDLRDLGMKEGATAGNVVSGSLPISAIKRAAVLPSLREMMPSYARTHVGRAESEADSAHAVGVARRNTGTDGSGQKVCALSDSYNQNNSASTSASDDIQSGDLPGNGNPEGNTSPIDVLDDTDTDGSDEGRAMLQLIHDIAPGATLGFHTATAGGLAAFASGIRDLADANCTVIVDDVRFNTEPFYQDGPVANAVDDVVINDGAAYFSSAGNESENSYEAPFRNSGQSGVINDSFVAHDFDSTSTTDTRQAITINPGGTFQIFSFQWTDPSAQVEGSSGPDTDIDIALVDEGGTIVAESRRSNTTVPVESVEYTNNEDSEVTLELVVEKAPTDPTPDEIKYVYSGNGFTIDEYDTGGPTIFGHPMATGAMAVAAAPFFNTARFNSNVDSSAILDFFSSRGGIEIRFDQNGNELITPQPREKPDVTGTDFVDNTFFGSDIDIQDPDDFPNFPGTSAAAPNIAAIAALIRQAAPGLAPTQVYDRLESTAVDVRFRQQLENGSISDELDPTGAGVDPWSGHGFVHAPDAVPDPVIADLSVHTTRPAEGAVELSWTVTGDPIESYELQRKYFDEPFETIATPDGPPVEVQGLGLGVFTFRLRWQRTDGTQGISTSVVDTLGIEGLTTEVVGEDDQGRRTVEVSWGVPQGPRSFTYRVERQKGEQGPFEKLGTTSQTTFRAERQVPGTYNYRVVSSDDQDNTLTSEPIRRQLDFEEVAFTLGPYPNPVQETASLDLTAQSTQDVTIEVFNTLGERVYRDEREIDALTPVTLSVDASRWSSGMYFLRVRGDEFTKTRKMVVVR